MWLKVFSLLFSGMPDSVQMGCQFRSLFVSTPNQPVTKLLVLLLMPILPQSHGDDWAKGQLSWYEELHLMSSWICSSRHSSVSLALVHSFIPAAWPEGCFVFLFLFCLTLLHALHTFTNDSSNYRSAFVPEIALCCGDHGRRHHVTSRAGCDAEVGT